VAILTGQDKLNRALHDTTCDGEWTLRVNDPCNATKLDAIVTAIEGLSFGGGSGAGDQLLSRIPITISLAQINNWVSVPLGGISLVADVTVFDSSDYEELFLDIRLLNNCSELEIRSKKPETFTIHVEGYA